MDLSMDLENRLKAIMHNTLDNGQLEKNKEKGKSKIHLNNYIKEILFRSDLLDMKSAYISGF